MAVQLSIFDEFNLFEPSPNTGQSPKLELENKPPSNGAQNEIATFAELIKNEVISVEPWIQGYFNDKWIG